MIFKSQSVADTFAWGEQLAKHLRPGDVIALHGDLGAGKTTLVGGIASGLGLPGNYRVTSPTFVIINVYPTTIPIYHLDLYRLESEGELAGLGISEYLGSDSIFIIEWFEKFPSVWTGDTIHVRMQLISDHTRSLEILATDERSLLLTQSLEAHHER